MKDSDLAVRIKELYLEGKSISEIAEAVGIDRSNVSRRLDRMNLKDKERSRKRALNIPEEELIKKYTEQNRSIASLAKEYGVSFTAIRDRLIKNNVALQSRQNQLKDTLLYDLYVNQGKTSLDISRELQVSRSTVDYRLKRLGVYRSPREHLKALTDEALIKHFVEQGNTLRETARYFGCTPKTIKRRLLVLGIHTESKGLCERYDVKKIRSLYFKEGKTISFIADRFDMDSRTVQKCIELAEDEVIEIPVKKKRIDHDHRIKYLSEHTGIETSFFEQFENLSRVRFILKRIKSATRRREIDKDYLAECIKKFYFDPNFNKQYEIYLETEKKQDIPSIDHIKAQHGSEDPDHPDNLHFMSWFENAAKSDLSWNEYLECIERYFGSEARKITEKKYKYLIEEDD